MSETQRFQSLLLWNGGADSPGEGGTGRPRKFQSLLLWNGGADSMKPPPAA